MADKTTTLKTKTGDNVYPNVIGDNRDNAIVDSAHINHTLTADHKINFRLDTNVSGLIFNSLQKPAGLTKTKLVGVGTNGQENIEIGDNLTLANGKLSATGGGSGGVNVLQIIRGGSFTGDIKTDNINLFVGNGTSMLVTSVINDTEYNLKYATIVDSPMDENGNYSKLSIMTFGQQDGENFISTNDIFIVFYTHFITLTNGTESIYITYLDNKGTSYNMQPLTMELSGKKLLCTGVLGNSDETLATPLYVSGEAGGLEVYYVLKNDTSGTISSKSITSFTIFDLVTPVE